MKRVLLWSLPAALLLLPTARATPPARPTPCAKAPSAGMVCVPGGKYIQGSNRNANHPKWKMRAESPRHTVTLDTFYVDKYEVTNAQYVQCMKAGYCPPPRYWARYKGSFWQRFRTPKRPFVRATWDHAYAYCRWAGKRLLTEAEWEAAARGPQGYTYPWGNSPPDCTKANYRVEPPHTSYPRPISRMRFCSTPGAKTLAKYGKDQTWPVGSTPAYRGIHDMAGNGYEWVQDFYDPHAYADCADPNSKHCNRHNPKGPCDGKHFKRCVQKTHTTWSWKKIRKVTKRKVNGRTKRTVTFHYKRIARTTKRLRRKVYRRRILKGGSWWWYADHMRGAFRRPDGPYTGTHRLSIRCGSSQPHPKPLPAKPTPPSIKAWLKRHHIR